MASDNEKVEEKEKVKLPGSFWEVIPDTLEQSKDLIPVLDQHGKGTRRLGVLVTVIVFVITLAIMLTSVDLDAIIAHWLKNQKPARECVLTGEGIAECQN